ncbi:HNH endonuclease [Microbacterium sp. SZ1]|uniref:HNH endonuclease n=1 Tax=Microbacterium sp. SZ1 TaxID=1849736 RepID=UPI001C549903|nr:HNH endonuclease signature motif containing protein [Microbacterium sp. SZ1]
MATTLETYGTRCHLCLRGGATSADHIVPRSHGGPDSLDNLRPSHKLCNSRRGDRSIAWFRARYCPELVAEVVVADAVSFFGTTTAGHPAPSPSIFSRPKQIRNSEEPAVDLEFFALEAS